MASNSASGYGVTAPAALDPFPIETKLAELAAGNNPGNAANLLSQYHQQQVASEGNYNYNLNQQHKFAYDQLHEQMANNYRNQMLEAGRQAGGLPLLNSPSFGGAGGGIDPNLVQQIDTGLRRAQDAKTFSEAGSGLSSTTAAGFQPSQAQADYATGGLAGQRTDPVAIQTAKLKLQGDLARAAASGAHAKYMQVPIKLGETSSGQPITGTYPVRIGASDEEIKQGAATALRTYQGFGYVPGTGLGGATPPPGTPPDTSHSIRPGTGTNLGVNPQAPAKPAAPATPATQQATPAQSAAPKQFVTDPQSQNAAKQAVKLLPPDQKKQVLANLQGAGGSVIPVIQRPNGRLAFVGRDGNEYEVPSR